MASRVSKSGGWMSAMSPHSNLDRSLSSRVGISFGGRSDEMTICLLISCSALNVWKNSSFVRSLPARNWTSSRSEEHTSELQSRENLVCRLLLEKKNNKDDGK